MITLGDFFEPSTKIIGIGIHLQVAGESGIFWVPEKTLNIPLCDFVQLQPPV